MSGERVVRKVKIELEAGKSKETIEIEYDFKNARIQSSNGTVKTFNLDYYWDRKAYLASGRILFYDVMDFLKLEPESMFPKEVSEDC